jgi:hypothetical protein
LMGGVFCDPASRIYFFGQRMQISHTPGDGCIVQHMASILVCTLNLAVSQVLIPSPDSQESFSITEFPQIRPKRNATPRFADKKRNLFVEGGRICFVDLFLFLFFPSSWATLRGCRHYARYAPSCSETSRKGAEVCWSAIISRVIPPHGSLLAQCCIMITC